MKVPSALLLRYFDMACRQLQMIIDDHTTSDEVRPLSSEKLTWHRNRIICSQTFSLDESLEKWNRSCSGRHPIDRESLVVVLRSIGDGNVMGIDFDHSMIHDNRNIATAPESDDMSVQKRKISEMMEKTNDLARLAFSASVLYMEWRLDQQQLVANPMHKIQSGWDADRKLRTLENEEIRLDRSSILEYCALVMNAVRLNSVQRFLEWGKEIVPLDNRKEEPSAKEEFQSAESRIVYIQNLFWRVLGLDSDFASNRFQQLLSGKDESNLAHSLMSDSTIVETLTKYLSSVSVAITNAASHLSAQSDDGTTRVVNVSYSEKIVSLQENHVGEDVSTIYSRSAPLSHSIPEHTTANQRIELEMARKTTQLQQNVWNEFECLPASEQASTLAKAKVVQDDFLNSLMNTPPGPERVSLMQKIDEESQKLLVIYKLWLGRASSIERTD